MAKSKKALFDLITDLETWKPQDRPIQFIEEYSPYKGMVDQEELDEDSTAPFLTEAYLYNLLGKEDARSLLGRWERIKKEIGYVDVGTHDY